MQTFIKTSTALLIAVTLNCALSVRASAELPEYSMVLVGGGLKSCSSMNLQQCQSGHQFTSRAGVAAKTTELYLLSPQAIHRIAGSTSWQAQRQAERQQLISILTSLQQQHGRRTFTASDLQQAMQVAAGELGQGVDAKALLADLSEPEWNLLFDELQVPVLDTQQRRLPEQVSLPAGKDSFSREIYEKIGDLAAKINKDGGKTKILVVTASSRDPFAAVDYYLDIFRQTLPAAQLDVSWLPLNAAYQRAQQTPDGCQRLPDYLRDLHRTYNRATVYPDLFSQLIQFCQQGAAGAVAQIEAADAIFFNGGDQSLTLQALTKPDGSDSAELAAIRRQLAAGRLLITGTSAGTAVQTGIAGTGSDRAKLSQRLPMISNGTSLHALHHAAMATAAPEPGCARNQSCPAGVAQDQLTYQANGGLGLFPFGVLDTHFSERGRELRLVRLLSDSQSRFGFGIDEVTALLVGRAADPNTARFAVVGAAGVFIADMAAAQTSLMKGQWQIRDVVTHYLTRGDSANWHDQQLTVQPAAWKSAVPPGKLTISGTVLPGDQYRQLADQLCHQSASHVLARVETKQLLLRRDSLSPAPQAQAWAGQQQTAQHGLLQRCSYQNFLLQISG